MRKGKREIRRRNRSSSWSCHNYTALRTYGIRGLSARGTDLVETEWLDLFIGRLTPGAAILDLDCGGGTPIGAELLRRGFAITGVDSSPSLIRHSRTSLPDGIWLVDDMRRFDPPYGFDGIVA